MKYLPTLPSSRRRPGPSTTKIGSSRPHVCEDQLAPFGNYWLNWVPAFAGMTEGWRVVRTAWKSYQMIALLLLLSSCSVHRLHQYDKEMNVELAQIGATINGKEPYLIKQSFQNEFYLNAEDHYKERQYDIYLNVSSSVGDWLIQTDSTILRKNLTLYINYSLKNLKLNKIITKGSARSLIIYSESPSAWSSYVSAEKAYENALNDAMRSVRIQVALFLAKQHHKDEDKPKRY
jgi:hypothetical protein